LPGVRFIAADIPNDGAAARDPDGKGKACTVVRSSPGAQTYTPGHTEGFGFHGSPAQTRDE